MKVYILYEHNYEYSQMLACYATMELALSRISAWANKLETREVNIEVFEFEILTEEVL